VSDSLPAQSRRLQKAVAGITGAANPEIELGEADAVAAAAPSRRRHAQRSTADRAQQGSVVVDLAEAASAPTCGKTSLVRCRVIPVFRARVYGLGFRD
jgi:hypothetical protein